MRPYWLWYPQRAAASWQLSQTVSAHVTKERPVDEGVELANGIL